MVKTKPKQKIKVDTLNSTLDKLDKLESKPKSEFNLRDSIYFLRVKLKDALKKGYSHEDLSSILEEQQIYISASTLKQYLTDFSKKSTSKRKRSKSTQITQGTLSNSGDKSKDVFSKNIEQDNSQFELDKNEIKVNSGSKIGGDLRKDSTQNGVSLSSDNSIIRKDDKESISNKFRLKDSTENKTRDLSIGQQDLSADFNQY